MWRARYPRLPISLEYWTLFILRCTDLYYCHYTFVCLCRRIQTESLPKIRLRMHDWMEYYDYKMFTRVLWWFVMKFAPLTCVFRCATCKQGRYIWKWVDTPESRHIVCLIFSRDWDKSEAVNTLRIKMDSLLATTNIENRDEYPGERIPRAEQLLKEFPQKLNVILSASWTVSMVIVKNPTKFQPFFFIFYAIIYVNIYLMKRSNLEDFSIVTCIPEKNKTYEKIWIQVLFFIESFKGVGLP